MKKHSNYIVFFILCAAVVLVNCHNKEYDLNVTPSNEFIRVSDVIVSGYNTGGIITIEANCGWTISTSSDYLQLSKTSGKNSESVSFSMDANPSSVESRVSSVTITSAGGIKTEIIITQGKNEELIELQPDSLEFYANETDTREFLVKANGKWTINGIPSWVSLSQTEGVGQCAVKVSVQENTSDMDRIPATLIIMGDKGTSAQIKIKQTGRNALLSTSPATIETEPAENTYCFTISGNVDWIIKVSNDWIYDLSAYDGHGKATVTFKCSDNFAQVQRRGCIYVQSESGRQQDSVVIIQQPAQLAELSIPVLVECDEKEAELTYSIIASPFPVTEYGLCYANTSNPTVSNNKVKYSNEQLTQGDFRTTLTGLTKGSTYYVRAYAISAVGTSYSEECVFVALPKPDNNDNDRPGI